MDEERPSLSNEWRRLSAWSVAHFSAKAVAQHVQGLIFAAPATYGASRLGSELAWLVPLLVIGAVLVSAVLRYHFYAYRLLDGSVQVRRGALFRESLDLAYTRIQNIRIQHPFYLRPLARVTVAIDAAGASGEEVSVPALRIPEAEAIRRHILERRSGLGHEQEADGSVTEAAAAATPAGGEVFFTRSVSDLVVHGLTNNRAYFALAGAAGVAWQMGFSPMQVVAWLGMRFEVSLEELSLIHLALLVVASTVLAVVVVAVVSVLESISSYFRFTMVRTAQGLTVTRGLLTRHEIHVEKSRIQTVAITQDWLDRLLGRCNVILEPVSHAQHGDEQRGAQQKRILVPSVRTHETQIITSEVLPSLPVDALAFTPVSRRYLHVRWAAVTALAGMAFLLYLGLALTVERLPGPTAWLPLLLPVAWALAMVWIYLRWRRGGLAVVDDVIVVRSGALGTDYRLFQTHKIQDVSHVQSVLMRRHGVSSLVFHTASTTIRVPHMSTAFMRSVVDYCLFRVASDGRSWM